MVPRMHALYVQRLHAGGSGVHAHFRAVDNDLSVFFCIWQTMGLMAVSGLALIVGIVALVLGAVMKCAGLHCATTNPEDSSAVFANSPLSFSHPLTLPRAVVSLISADTSLVCSATLCLRARAHATTRSLLTNGYVVQTAFVRTGDAERYKPSVAVSLEGACGGAGMGSNASVAAPAPPPPPKDAQGDGYGDQECEKTKVEWGYEGAKAAKFWGTLSTDWAVCDSGQKQSPIDIQVHLKALEHNCPVHQRRDG